MANNKIETALRYKCGCNRKIKLSYLEIDAHRNFAIKVDCPDCFKK